MRVESIILVRALVLMIGPLVIPLSEVAQGPCIVLPLGYEPLDVVSLVGGAALLNISANCLRATV